jgi:hypothetical protein
VAEDADFYDCTVSDLSLKGCRVSLTEKLPQNKRFKLTLVLSDDCSLDVEAWVAWHKTVEEYNIYGIYFARIRDSEREKIYQLIRRDFSEQVNKQWWEGGENMEDATFADRRIFERFSVRLPLKFLGVGAGWEGEAQTCNISAKGIGLVTKHQLPLHTALEIWLHIPDKGQPLYARGKVIWSKPDAAGGHRLGVNLEKAELMGMSRVLKTM